MDMIAEPAATPRRVIAVVPDDGSEPTDLDDRAAETLWAVLSCAWHPVLLARAGSLPKVRDAAIVTIPDPGDVLLLAPGASARLPEDHAARAAGAGAVAIEAAPGAGRIELAGQVLAQLDPSAPVELESDPIALDFLALGTVTWMLRDLTAAMGHVDCLDRDSLAREVLAGAHAYTAGDRPAAANHLRAAFEVLTQARERFYPVDAYITDLCLLDPASPPGSLADALAARAAFTVLGTARAVDVQAGHAPQDAAAFREAVAEGWADLAGGAFDEVDEPLLPLESIFWQFRRGAEVYRRNLDDRNVETLARRRFGLYPQLPQIARRFGFRFALHLGLDAGVFPVRPEAKRLWEAPDHSTLESLIRPPMAADRAVEGLRLPWVLARTMKDDHVATLPLAHWPEPVAGWYRDLRRVAAYSPVLARWVTLADYFHLTDRPYETFRVTADEYITPYLAQAAAGRDPAPVSGRARHARLRARFDAQVVLGALKLAITAAPVEADDPADLEGLIETRRSDEAAAALETREPALAAALAGAVVGAGTDGRPGYLVVNPLGVARRAVVLLPDAAADLHPEGPLRAAQLIEEGVAAVVDLAAFGYAWVPREPLPDPFVAPAGTLSARDRTLGNESIEVEFDAATGGLRSIRAPGDPIARLGQQLVVTGHEAGPSTMRGSAFAVDYAGPALIQATSAGELISAAGRRLAAFRQRVRLWVGRPILELDVDLTDLDPAWAEKLAGSDPWEHHLACRWAWPDPGATLRRLCLLAPEPTTAARPETPDALDIMTRRQRTALLFGGLAHHRRHGPRMLDTLLVAGAESATHFRLGIVLDLEHPHQAALDFLSPPVLAPTAAGPPAAGPAGWFFTLDHPGVAVTRVAPNPEIAPPAVGLIFHLVETAGRPCRCRLRLVRNPSHARQVDFGGSLLADLPIEGDAVLIDLTPNEIARLEVTLG